MCVFRARHLFIFTPIDSVIFGPSKYGVQTAALMIDIEIRPRLDIPFYPAQSYEIGIRITFQILIEYINAVREMQPPHSFLVGFRPLDFVAGIG